VLRFHRPAPCKFAVGMFARTATFFARPGERPAPPPPSIKGCITQPYHLTVRLAIALALFACVALGLISGAYYVSRRAALPARLLIISGAVAVVVYMLWIFTSLRI
jgi:hypothetical protein